MKSGMSLSSVLFVVFLVLKLTGTVTWTWLWVFSPLWISAAVGLVVMASLFMTFGRKG